MEWINEGRTGQEAFVTTVKSRWKLLIDFMNEDVNTCLGRHWRREATRWVIKWIKERSVRKCLLQRWIADENHYWLCITKRTPVSAPTKESNAVNDNLEIKRVKEGLVREYLSQRWITGEKLPISLMHNEANTCVIIDEGRQTQWMTKWIKEGLEGKYFWQWITNDSPGNVFNE